MTTNRPHSRWRRRLGVVGTIAASVALGACGSSSHRTTPTTPAATPRTIPSGVPIKVMIAGTLDGPTELPELPHGAEAAADQINAEGGVKGRPIDVIVCDDNNPSPDACARKAVSEHVAAVVGSQSNGINPILEASGIPQVGPYPFINDDYTQPNSFPVSAGSAAAGGAVKLLAGLGIHKIVPLALTGASATSTAVSFMQQTAAKTPGITISSTIGLPFPSTDLSAEVSKAASSGAEAMVVLAFPTQNVQVLQAARAAGVTQKLVFSSATFPQALVDHLKSAANGVYTISSFLPVSSTAPAMQRFNREMAKYAPGQELSDISLNSWAAMQTFAIAATHARTIDARGITRVLPTLGTIELGVTAPFSFAHAGALSTAPRVVNLGTFGGVVKNGVITALSSTPTPAYP
ncbi:MAG TPA: ABC transporter substrate-binding protein [Solirubrobacteraceae bacterium]|jgi:ABC-type branched-subunit amino acid transport system substrate-binding protein|nr:ABC transporter substrate-binding protein [Solirubrobacteraceae bacterium]